jgi:hypothetical protein
MDIVATERTNSLIDSISKSVKLADDISTIVSTNEKLIPSGKRLAVGSGVIDAGKVMDTVGSGVTPGVCKARESGKGTE